MYIKNSNLIKSTESLDSLDSLDSYKNSNNNNSNYYTIVPVDSKYSKNKKYYIYDFLKNYFEIENKDKSLYDLILEIRDIIFNENKFNSFNQNCINNYINYFLTFFNNIIYILEYDFNCSNELKLNHINYWVNEYIKNLKISFLNFEYLTYLKHKNLDYVQLENKINNIYSLLENKLLLKNNYDLLYFKNIKNKIMDLIENNTKIFQKLEEIKSMSYYDYSLYYLNGYLERWVTTSND